MITINKGDQFFVTFSISTWFYLWHFVIQLFLIFQRPRAFIQLIIIHSCELVLPFKVLGLGIVGPATSFQVLAATSSVRRSPSDRQFLWRSLHFTVEFCTLICFIFTYTIFRCCLALFQLIYIQYLGKFLVTHREKKRLALGKKFETHWKRTKL